MKKLQKLTSAHLGNRLAETLNLSPSPEAATSTSGYVVLDPFDIVKVLPEESPDRENSFQEGLDELMDSLSEHARTHSGVGNHTAVKLEGFQKPYKIVMGRRRIYAAQKLGMKVKAEIEQYAGPLERFLATVSENVDRRNYSAYELVKLAGRARDEFKLEPEQIARQLGRSIASVYVYFKVLANPNLLEKMRTDVNFSLRQAEAIFRGKKGAAKASSVQGHSKEKSAKTRRALVTKWDKRQLQMNFSIESATEGDWKRLNTWLDRVRQVIHKHNSQRKARK